MPIISLLITALVFGLVCYVIFWTLSYLGVPEPIRKVAVVVAVLIAIIWILNNFIPGSTGHVLWR